MNAFMIILSFLTIYAPVLIIVSFTPYLTRKTESFGVAIPEEVYDDDKVKRIRHRYRNNVLLWGSIIAAIALFVELWKQTFILFSISVFVEIALSFVFYLRGHKEMKLLKTTNQWTKEKSQRTIIDTDFRKKRILVSPWWFLLYAIIIGVTFTLSIVMYDKIPNQIPMSYNMTGEVIRWVDKSYKALALAPIFQTFITLLMLFVYWTIGRARQQVDAASPEKSIEQNRIFRYSWSAFVVFTGLAILGLFSFMQLTFIGLITNVVFITIVPLLISGIIVISALILSIKLGQGGSRLSMKQPTHSHVVNRDDDKYWKMGIFYYNPNDPALFVEKRFGIGWTNNFARPMSWILIVAFTGLMILLFFITKF